MIIRKSKKKKKEGKEEKERRGRRSEKIQKVYATTKKKATYVTLFYNYDTSRCRPPLSYDVKCPNVTFYAGGRGQAALPVLDADHVDDRQDPAKFAASKRGRRTERLGRNLLGPTLRRDGVSRLERKRLKQMNSKFSWLKLTRTGMLTSRQAKFYNEDSKRKYLSPSDTFSLFCGLNINVMLQETFFNEDLGQQHWNDGVPTRKICRNNVALLYCAENRRCVLCSRQCPGFSDLAICYQILRNNIAS